MRALSSILPLALLAVVGCNGFKAADAPPGDAGGADEAIDGGAVDDATTVDSGPRFCETLNPPFKFCADYDQGGFEDGWDNATKNPDDGVFGGGALAAETTDVRSSPTAVSCKVPALIDGTVKAGAELQKTLPERTTFLALVMKVLVKTEYFPATNGGLDSIAWLNYYPDGSILFVRNAKGVELWVSEGATAPTTKTYAIVHPVPVGEWHEIQLLVRDEPLDGGPNGTVDVLIDDAPVLTLPAPLPASFQPPGTPPAVYVGAFAKGPMGESEVIVDDVRITW
jgi:hypothetical protein